MSHLVVAKYMLHAITCMSVGMHVLGARHACISTRLHVWNLEDYRRYTQATANGAV